MARPISDNKFNRQIDHLIKHLPDQEALTGKRQGSSYYLHVNGRSFVEAHKTCCKHLSGLESKFELTSSQKGALESVQQGLVKKVEKAFVNHDHPPANLESFLQPQQRKSY